MFLSSYTQEKGLEGIWYAAYTISDGNQSPLSETTLLQFKDNQLFSIKIRDFSTGEFNKISIDTSEYKFSNGKLKFKSYSPRTELTKDSLTLEFENQTLVLRRIPESLKNVKISADCFHGSYIIKSENYQDSIDFVNDSLLIYTGEYHQNFPIKKWQIIEYEDLKFLNIYGDLQPITIVKSCNSNGIQLVYPSIQVINIRLTPTIGEIAKEQLIGEWTEIENSYPSQPPPPNLKYEDLLYSVNIKRDSIEIGKFKRTKTYKWNLTSDGKRIYFIDRLFENEGSWKLLNLSETIMTVRISSHSGAKEELVKFERKKNGR